jgi:radical SAM protein with 4Fe4S-binding SPASM domain
MGIRAIAAKLIHRIRPIVQDRTLTVQTDLANYCNLRCRMCFFYTGSPEVRIRLSFDEFLKRFDSFADRIHTFGLSCATEPLVMREEDLRRVFKWIRDRAIPESFMVTNAMLLRPKLAEVFIDSGLSRLVVSLDSHIREKYEAIRLGAKFETVIKNVRYFDDYRRSKGLASPQLQINCVLMRRNIEEVGPFLDFIHELGADAVDFRHLVPYSGLDIERESLVHFKELTNENLRIARAKCAELGVRIASIPDEFSFAAEPAGPQEPTKRACLIPNTFLYVRPDGNIQPCVLWFGEEPVGNLANEVFETVWNQPAYATFRDEVSRGILTRRCCRTCPSIGGGSVDNEGSFEEKSP